MRNRLPNALKDIKEKGNYRTLRYVKPLSTTRILYESKEYLNLCSNSYLSLHNHPYLIRAAQTALDVYGAGTCSSRSVSGSIDLYKVLEEEIALAMPKSVTLMLPLLRSMTFAGLISLWITFALCA